MKFNLDMENKVLEFSHELKGDLFTTITVLGEEEKEDSLRKWTFIQIYKPTKRKFSLPVIDKEEYYHGLSQN